MEKNMYQEEDFFYFTHGAAEAELKMHKLFVPLFAPNELVNKAAGVCIWDSNMEQGGQDLGFTLGQLSGFSTFWSSFHTMYGRGAFVRSVVSISVHSLCVS